MATDERRSDAETECQIAMEAAVGAALDHCTDEQAIQQELGRILGVEPDRNCQQSLSEGLDEPTCTDFEGLRQWVLCRAHDILDSQQVPFSTAMEQAWSEARDECDMADAAI